jgi:hypothetical protein
MSQLQCKRCLELGHQCGATHETEAGVPTCVFCLDNLPCPVQRKQRRGKTPPDETPPSSSGESEKPASEVESEEKMPELRENSTETAPKLCKRPGCEMKLSIGNSSGLCQKHARWTGARTEAASNGIAKTNGHAHAGNGHTNGGKNGAAAVLPELALDRVDHLIASIPAADKARLAFAWLKGEL